MDLGTFRWGKKGFLLWVIGPPILMTAVLLPVALYNRHVEHDCNERQAILRQLPEMNRQIARARETLQLVIAGPAGGDAADGAAEVSQRIYKAAEKHGFAIRSLTADKDSATSASGLAALTVSVQGEGALPDIIAMFDDLHAPDQLCAVDKILLKAPRNGAEQLPYSGDIVFHCHVVSVTRNN
jgi:hypothetical protein